jgi:hypothetical protein
MLTTSLQTMITIHLTSNRLTMIRTEHSSAFRAHYRLSPTAVGFTRSRVPSGAPSPTPRRPEFDLCRDPDAGAPEAVVVWTGGTWR